MIRKISISNKDRTEVENVKIDKKLLDNDSIDYSKVVVNKPWGYEYLIYQNEYAAVWILFIKEGFKTSMHCHPKKKTSLMVSNTKMDKYYLLAKEIGSSGGKIIGAGGGGFFMFYCKDELIKKNLIKKFNELGLIFVRFPFEPHGTKIVLDLHGVKN